MKTAHEWIPASGTFIGVASKHAKIEACAQSQSHLHGLLPAFVINEVTDTALALVLEKNGGVAALPAQSHFGHSAFQRTGGIWRQFQQNCGRRHLVAMQDRLEAGRENRFRKQEAEGRAEQDGQQVVEKA